jgi:leader peptidase (prepilin peptidase)/N-methyltransferase
MMPAMALWQAFFFSPAGLCFVALYGAAVGSFLNVVAYRLPRGISTMAPRSRCPRCASAIRPWHNLPVAGWLLLGGRCGDCRLPISARYPLVEAGTAALFVLAFLRHEEFATALFACAVAAWALVLALIDLDLRVLPDALTLPAAAIGIAIHAFGFSFTEAGFRDALAASLLAFAGLGLLAAGWRRLFREDGFGAGDVRMAAALGALFGGQALLLLLCGAAVLALAAGLAEAAARRRGEATRRRGLPFGAALGAATIAFLLFFQPP